jgi:hypothetical protein
MDNVGSVIRDKHPRYATLKNRKLCEEAKSPDGGSLFSKLGDHACRNHANV